MFYSKELTTKDHVFVDDYSKEFTTKDHVFVDNNLCELSFPIPQLYIDEQENMLKIEITKSMSYSKICKMLVLLSKDLVSENNIEKVNFLVTSIRHIEDSATKNAAELQKIHNICSEVTNFLSTFDDIDDMFGDFHHDNIRGLDTSVLSANTDTHLPQLIILAMVTLISCVTANNYSGDRVTELKEDLVLLNSDELHTAHHELIPTARNPTTTTPKKRPRPQLTIMQNISSFFGNTTKRKARKSTLKRCSNGMRRERLPGNCVSKTTHTSREETVTTPVKSREETVKGVIDYYRNRRNSRRQTKKTTPIQSREETVKDVIDDYKNHFPLFKNRF